jgi:uncharacterized membrane protein YhaH (DUF805 family)
MNWYVEPFTKYATFDGRARRKEFWYFVLVNALIGYLILRFELSTGNIYPETGFGLLTIIFSLVIFLPSLTVSVRRLHDTGHSGWWILIGPVPIIGALVLIVFYIRDSDPSQNDYGLNPKTETIT